MKINGFGSIYPSVFEKNKEKPTEKSGLGTNESHSTEADGGAAQGQPGYDDNPRNSRHLEDRASEVASEREEQKEAPTPTSDQLNQAIQSFQTDIAAQSHHLRASVEGTGPGLKVVLRDGTGNIIRHFTSAEFVRLTGGASKDSVVVPGKILDRKL